MRSRMNDEIRTKRDQGVDIGKRSEQDRFKHLMNMEENTYPKEHDW